MKKLPFYEIRERAKWGDAFAQVLLGFLLEHGLRMAPNKEMAEEFYRQAAEQAYAPGQLALGFLVADTDPTEALLHFERASESGYAPAQFVLGCIYSEGEIVKSDPVLAVRWLNAAAKQTYIPAIAYLSIVYSDGRIIEPDTVKARTYLREAAEKGDPGPAWRHGVRLVEEGLKGNNAKIQEGKEWIWRAAMQSNSSANMFLAEMYGDGLYGAKKDKHLEEFFLSRATSRDEDLY